MQAPDFVRQYLDSHVSESVRLEEIASAAHQSVEHVIRSFKAAYGMTPHQYLLESKIRLSCVMLAATDKTVEDIAAELGFYDAHHFSARFQKLQGCRPSVFRREFRRQDGT
jgi:AraC-like DNA-binding protein